LEHNALVVFVFEQGIGFATGTNQLTQVCLHLLHNHELLLVVVDDVEHLENLPAGALLQPVHNGDLSECRVVDAVVCFIRGKNEPFHRIHFAVEGYFVDFTLAAFGKEFYNLILFIVLLNE